MRGVALLAILIVAPLSKVRPTGPRGRIRHRHLRAHEPAPHRTPRQEGPNPRGSIRHGLTESRSPPRHTDHSLRRVTASKASSDEFWERVDRAGAERARSSATPSAWV